MKKVLIFSLVYYPKFVGGAEVALKEITDRINPEEVAFDMVTLRVHKSVPKTERIGNINVYRVGFGLSPRNPLFKLNLAISKYLFPFLSSSFASHLHKKKQYDSIWSMMANYAGFGASFFKKKHKNVEFILTLQEGDPPEYIEKRVGLLRPAFKNIFKRADKLQAISKYLAKWGKEKGFKGEPVVIPNAVDLELFGQIFNGDEMASLEEKFDKKEGDIFLVTTSRLVKKNGIEDVIYAMTRFPKRVKFLVLGEGEEESKLKKISHKLGLEERVRFLGYVPHGDMPKYLKVSDIFVRPSLSEGLGNSFLEAMAAEIPVVGTMVGGIPDFLEDRKTGIAVEPGNPEDLANKVKDLIKTSRLREDIVANARRMVEERYDWNIIARRIKEEVFLA